MQRLEQLISEVPRQCSKRFEPPGQCCARRFKLRLGLSNDPRQGRDNIVPVDVSKKLSLHVNDDCGFPISSLSRLA